MTERRAVLISLGGMATMALPSLPLRVLAQDNADSTSLTDSLTLINAGGANQVAYKAGAGLILVDSGPVASIESLLATLNTLHEAGVNTLFNTHWHEDQCGGNEVLGKLGATIIAHQKTRQRLSTEYYIPHEERYHHALPEAAWPTEIFHDQGELTVGSEIISYGWLVEPHTDGDIYVYFRNANILVAGDAVSPLRDPELDWYGGGWLGGRVNSLQHLLAISNENTLIIPAYGAPMQRQDLQSEHDLMQEVYNRVLDLVREGCSAGCMLQEGALAGLNRNWINPEKFLYDAYKGMWAHHYNLAPNIL